MAMIRVQAPPGRKFPMEWRVRKYITETPMEVESSAYYRRAVLDGDLIQVTTGSQVAAKAVAPADDKKDKKAASNE